MHTITNYQTNSSKERNDRSSSKSASGGKKVQKKNGKKGSSSGSAWGGFVDVLTHPKTIQIYGILITLFAILSFISIVSYYFTWEGDRAFVHNGGEDIVANWCGKMGAYLAVWFTEYIFGIFSISLPIIFFMCGVKITFHAPFHNLVRLSSTILLTTAWLSMLLAFFLIPRSPDTHESSMIFLAGAFGEMTTTFLVDSTGRIATLFILLAIILGILLLCYNLSPQMIAQMVMRIRLPKRRKKLSRTDTSAHDLSDDETKVPAEDLPDMYISTRNELSNEYDKNKISFEDEEVVPSALPDQEGSHEMPVMHPESSAEFEVTLNPVAEVDAESTPSEQKSEGGESPTQNTSLADIEEYDPRKDLSYFQFPSVDLLNDGQSVAIDEATRMQDLREKKERIEETLNNFGIAIKKIYATVGPTVTLYEIVPEAGVRISKIKNLENDIALSLAALGIRIIAPIPGKGTIGIEVPNSNPEMVPMKDIFNSRKFIDCKYDLPIGIGKTISNEPFVADLAKMPHLLVAGATGQGKSVGLNAIIASLLYKKHPAELKLVLIDPKKVELSLYKVIENHYLATLPDAEEPIISDVKKVIYTLNSLCIEMDTRYNLLQAAGVRNIKEYNSKFCRRQLSPTNGHRYLPYIVLIIDEFADMIMVAGREVEAPIARLAQLARAIGIHLIIATQRPSVKIITGNIKANFPARIAFRVSSGIDSRTILDHGGAEQLIGKGDMLLYTGSDLIRMQCAFIDTPEVERLAAFIADQQGYAQPFLLPNYQEEEKDPISSDDALNSNEIDELFMDAATLIVETQQGSTSYLQRKMSIGYNRSGRLMDQLEEFKIVGASRGSKPREVLVQSQEELRQIFKAMGLI